MRILQFVASLRGIPQAGSMRRARLAPRQRPFACL